MSYITEILAFNDLLLSQPLSTGQIALWYALMYINNKSGWVEWFSAPNRTLEFYTGLSRQGVNKARNSLKQSGLIDFKSSGTKATMYKLTRMSKSVQDSIQDSVQVEDDSDHTMSNSLQVGLQRSLQNSIQSSVQSSIQSGLQSSSTLIRQEENRRDKTKKEREKKDQTYNEILDRLVEDENLKAAYLEFIKMRKLIKKPMTNKALEMLIRKVDKLEPESIERKIELLDNAVLHNWQSVYPLKDNDFAKDGGDRPDSAYCARNYDGVDDLPF